MDMYLRKPVIKEFPYSILRENHFRNMLFQACHNMEKQAYIGYVPQQTGYQGISIFVTA
jgi:hypothetical protein